MKIAIFTDAFLPTIDGAVMSIKNSTEILSKENKIFLFVPSNSSKEKLRNVEYIELKSYNLRGYKDYKARFPSFIKCYNQLKKIKPDVVHLESIFGIAWEGLISAKLLGIPIVITSHTVFPDVMGEISLLGMENQNWFKNLLWKYMVFFLNLCDVIVSPSETMKEELIKHGVKRSINVISNGINTREFIFYKRKKQRETIILYVGRLVSSKQVNVLLKAFKLIVEKKLKARFWIVGSGPLEKELTEYVIKNKIEKYVKFFGYIENNKLLEIYKKADIFATASTIETEGISILEAMSTGLPVIGVNSRAVPLLVKKDIGFIAKPHNEKEIAEFLTKLVNNYNMRLKFGKNASEKAKEYELEKVVLKLYNLYKSLTKNKS